MQREGCDSNGHVLLDCLAPCRISVSDLVIELKRYCDVYVVYMRDVDWSCDVIVRLSFLTTLRHILSVKASIPGSHRRSNRNYRTLYATRSITPINAGGLLHTADRQYAKSHNDMKHWTEHFVWNWCYLFLYAK